MSGLGEAERKRIHSLEMKSPAGQRGLVQVCSGTEISSGTVEKTRSQRRQEKKMEKKKEKKENKKESNPRDPKVGDPSATPSSHAPQSRPIFFQYVEGSMNLTLMVGADFDASENSLEMRGLCVQVSDIYSSRLGIASPVSHMKFNFTLAAPDHMLVTLKDDEMGLGFEDQVNRCKTSLSDTLIKNERCEETLLSVQAQLKVMESLQVRHAINLEKLKLDLEEEITAEREKNTAEREKITALQQEVQTQKQELQTQRSSIDELLTNAELQYITRRRILLEEARKKFLRKLGLKKEDGVTWEDFINNLSPSRKVAAGISTDVLELLASGMQALNKAVHTSDNILEIAHAVNSIRKQTQKTAWQGVFTFVFDRNPEDVEF